MTPSKTDHRALIVERLNRLIQIGRRNRAVYFDPKRAALKLKISYEEVLGEGRIEIAGYYVGDLENNVFHMFDTDISNDEVIDVLDKLRYAASEEEREKGYSNLYLVIGLLCWTEGNDHIKSPLIIARCKIEAKLDRRRGYKKYYLQIVDEPELNPSLRMKMWSDFSVDLEEIWEGSENISMRERLDIFYKNLIELLRPRGWDVEKSLWIARLTGFENQPIYEDGIGMLNNGIFDRCTLVRALCGDHTFIPLDIRGSSDPTDIEVEKLETPFPCDEAQCRAIILAEKGRNVIVHGPPGTGKSQLIANLLARSIINGKKVLFVTEKRDAAEVVYKRLSEKGLDSHILFIHAIPDRARRDQILKELYSIVSRRHINPALTLVNWSEIEFPEESLKIIQNYARWFDEAYRDLSEIARLELTLGIRLDNAYTIRNILRLAKPWESIHSRRPDIIKRLSGLWEKLRECMDDINTLQRLDSKVIDVFNDKDKLDRFFNNDATSDFIGLYYLLYSYMGETIFKDPSRLSSIFYDARELLEIVRDGEALLHCVLKCVSDYKYSERFSEVAEKIISKKSQLKQLEANLDIILRTSMRELLTLRDRLVSFGLFHRIFRYGQFRHLAIQICSKLGIKSKTNREFLERALSLAIDLYKELETLRELCLKDEHDDNAHFDDLINNLREYYHWSLHDLFLDLHQLMDLIDQINARSHRELVQIINSLYKLHSEGLYKMIKELLNDGGETVIHLITQTLQLKLNPQEVVSLSKYYEHFTRFYRSPHIETFNIIKYHEQVYSDKWQIRAELSRKQRLSQLDRNTLEMFANLMKWESDKKRKKMPIRKLLENYSELVLAIKPIVIASPLTVCMLPRRVLFDFVIFDEASQIKLEKALTSIARGQVILVIGDEKQMPPTTYFERVAEEGDEGEEDSYESLLECVLKPENAIFFNSVWLKWYYRGEHESLIAFSNREFYDDMLITFPSVDNRPRCYLKYLQGARYRSGKRINEDEAKAVLETIVDGLENGKISEKDTVMVVTMNMEQQNLVTRILERYKDVKLTSSMGSEAAKIAERIQYMVDSGKLSVRNLETVQGSEADIVILSLTYGRDADSGRLDGRFFGPLNRVGGERRINVLVSRARREVIVISSISSKDLDELKDKSRGVEVLRKYLAYLENGCRLERPKSEGLPESYFEQLVITELRRALNDNGLGGLELDPQVGVGNYRIDIGIRKGDKYILGIECDGAIFHSFSSVRDRDYIRQKHLERLGWRIYRIWSYDWWRNRKQVINSIIEEIKKCMNTNS